MKRRFFLGLAAAALLSGAVSARAQSAPQTPSDRITVEEFRGMLAEGKPVLALDVRGAAELVIKGARHIPLEQLESRLGELPKGREIVTYCAWPSEATSARAAQILRGHDFKARALLGGWAAWREAGGETEPLSAGTDGGGGHTHTHDSPHPATNKAAPGTTPAEVKPAPAEATAAAKQAPAQKARKRKRRPRSND